jgi:hypothetical protein
MQTFYPHAREHAWTGETWHCGLGKVVCNAWHVFDMLLLGRLCVHVIASKGSMLACLVSSKLQRLFATTSTGVGRRIAAYCGSLSTHRPPHSCHCLLPLLLLPRVFQALKDWFVGVPNGVGAAFNLICVVFCFAFPAKGRSRLQGQVNPAANWGVLRLQSTRNPDTGAREFESAATAGGYFDVSQFRWRSGAVGSFVRVASGGRFGSGRRGSATAAAAAVDVLPVTAARGSMDGPADSGTPDCKVQDIDLVVVGEGKGEGADKHAAAVVATAADGAAGPAAVQQARDQHGS